MNSDKKNKIGIGQKSAFSQIEKVHPIRMLLYLSMAGIGILFSVLLVAYAQASLQGENNLAVQVPRYFSVSTILLLVSSYVLSHTSRNYKKDNLIRMRRNLGITLVLGLLFIFSQLAGWQEIAASGVTYKGQASGTYIYLISALHIVHIIGGMIFLVFLFFKTLHASTDAVRSLIFIRDPFRLMQVRMLKTYWHFMDILWVGLYLVFLFIF